MYKVWQLATVLWISWLSLQVNNDKFYALLNFEVIQCRRACFRGQNIQNWNQRWHIRKCPQRPITQISARAAQQVSNTTLTEVPVFGRCGLILINNMIEAMNFQQFENQSSERFLASISRYGGRSYAISKMVPKKSY